MLTNVNTICLLSAIAQMRPFNFLLVDHTFIFRYMTDGGLNLYTRSLNRMPDTVTSRDAIQRGVHDVTVDADR